MSLLSPVFFSSLFCDIYICSIFPSSRCEVVFSVSVAKSLALWFVSSVHTTLSVFSAARQNLETTIFCLFTRRALLSLTGNCESISFRCTVPLGCFRTIAERKSNVSGYLLQNGTQLYVLLDLVFCWIVPEVLPQGRVWTMWPAVIFQNAFGTALTVIRAFSFTMLVALALELLCGVCFCSTLVS